MPSTTLDLIRQVPPDTKIWRYMDYDKFVSLINRRALFFAQAKRLGDPYEGSMYRKLKGLPENSDLEKTLKTAYSAINGWRSYAVVSCWHMNPFESVSMWKLYAGQHRGIAIQSTVERLRNSLTDNSPFMRVLSGAITYSDEEPDVEPGSSYGGTEVSLFTKRPEYSSEQEFRVVLYVREFHGLDSVGGCFVASSLETLIESIYIAPTQASYIPELIQEFLRTYALDFPVHKSRLDGHVEL